MIAQRSKAHLFVLLTAALSFPYPLSAREIVQDFTNGIADASSTGVLNIASGQIHLPFVVDRNEGAGGGAPPNDVDEDEAVNIGRGGDGAFDTSTYARWDLDSNPSTVTLDTSRIYEFTTFNLNTGTTLLASGTAPLRLRVQSTVTINGTIDVSGDDGSFVSGSAAAGGSAHAGGAAGAAGGSPFVGAADAGTSADGAVGGGAGGTSGNPANGGGGAGYGTAGVTGSGGTAAGATYSDEYITGLLLGGSGGGGGGGQNVGNTFGASGGGGGGVVFIQAGGKISIGSTGAILADGGNGGEGAGGGGNGGAGSGGAIVLVSGSTIENAGTLEAIGGTGPNGTTGAGSGQGSVGRIRYVSFIGDITPIGSGSEQPAPTSATFGQTYYKSLASATVITPAYDSQNSAPTYTLATPQQTVPAGSSITLEIAGSSDGFVADDTGWVSLSNLGALQSKRYYRFRAQLQAGLRGETPVIESVQLSVNDREQPVFSFTLGTCAGTPAPTMNTSPWSAPASLVLMALWLLWLRELGRKSSTPSRTTHSFPPSTLGGHSTIAVGSKGMRKVQ
jgi:hypothetical protein